MRYRHDPVRRLLGDESGLTLAELLVVSGLMLFVLAALYNVVGAGQSYYNRVEGDSVAVGYGNVAMNDMSKQLRQALNIVTSVPGYGTVTPGSDQVAVTADYDDDDQYETLAYILNSQGRLIRLENEPNSSVYTQTELARNVTNQASGLPMLTYYDSTGTVISDVTRIPGRTYRVRIQLAVDQHPTRPPGALILNTMVYRRNNPSGV